MDRIDHLERMGGVCEEESLHIYKQRYRGILFMTSVVVGHP